MRDHHTGFDPFDEPAPGDVRFTIQAGQVTGIEYVVGSRAIATGLPANATFIVGTFNSAFVNFYGMEPLFQGTGKTTFNLAGSFDGTVQGGGDINGSVSDLTQVPEPASLALLGSGLLATGGFMRRKLIA